jgi:hypothetical protein
MAKLNSAFAQPIPFQAYCCVPACDKQSIAEQQSQVLGSSGSGVAD